MTARPGIDPLADEPGADGIDEGKRLIRVGGDSGRSLAERLAERLHLLAWRTPFHGLRLGGRYPLKLLTVADDPFAGDVARGRALLDGTLVFRGERRAVVGLDLKAADWSRAFGDHLHSFAWLRDLSTVATRADAAPVAEHLTRAWLAAHGDAVADPAWRPDLWGRRILAWVAHAPLILSSTDLIYRSKLLTTLARGARHLERTADRAPAGPGRIAAWSGVVAAGLLIPGGDTRRALGEAGLARALDASITSDGGIVGRSGAGQLDALMLLVALRAVYAARRMDMPDAAEMAVNRLVPPLLGLAHGDRGLSSWQGGGPISGDTIDAVVTASGVRTRPLRQAREWGYQRLSAMGTLLVMDAAPPPVARAVDGGCASTLAFELSDGPNRIVVNCGGARMANATLPAALCEGLRTTAAHSTLVLGDANSTALQADGSLGRGVGEVELARGETDAASRIEASHDGYVRRMGFLHRRTIALGSDGRDVRGEDSLIPSGRTRPKAKGFAIRFHLAPTVEVAATADGQGAVLRLPGNILWQFRCKGAVLALEESLWIDGDGRPHPTEQIVVSGEATPGGTSVSWWFHRSK
ncbi:heparinase II/III family protein [Sphingomonas donggukensis]|uniref:Heparinase II/III family protein n=1 Tax=Sphingomonas donggukensis TaxID=2949093 RepID=A0ABY4TTX6_9SPHN|nr:heparinase II/III family protein [Sphingomonas donggukensis]URW75727.1 heparinase II/III family protein [Sphingomonas donggukensis]